MNQDLTEDLYLSIEGTKIIFDSKTLQPKLLQIKEAKYQCYICNNEMDAPQGRCTEYLHLICTDCYDFVEECKCNAEVFANDQHLQKMYCSIRRLAVHRKEIASNTNSQMSSIFMKKANLFRKKNSRVPSTSERSTPLFRPNRNTPIFMNRKTDLSPQSHTYFLYGLRSFSETIKSICAAKDHPLTTLVLRDRGFEVISFTNIKWPIKHTTCLAKVMQWDIHEDSQPLQLLFITPLHGEYLLWAFSHPVRERQLLLKMNYVTRIHTRALNFHTVLEGPNPSMNYRSSSSKNMCWPINGHSLYKLLKGKIRLQVSLR